MFRRSLLAATLLCAAACGPSATEPRPARASAGALHDDAPPPPPPPDTTQRGGGTIGSGT